MEGRFSYDVEYDLVSQRFCGISRILLTVPVTPCSLEGLRSTKVIAVL